jgi:hypothetical protein
MANVCPPIQLTNSKEFGASFCCVIRLQLYLHVVSERIMTLRDTLELSTQVRQPVTQQELLHVVFTVAAAVLNPGQ